MNKSDKFPPIDEMLEAVRGVMGDPEEERPSKEEAGLYCIANTWGLITNKCLVLEVAHLKKVAAKFADPSTEGQAVAVVRAVLHLYFKSLRGEDSATSKALN